MTSLPINTKTLKVRAFTDTSQTGVNLTTEWALTTTDVQKPRAKCGFLYAPESGMWHKSRGEMRPIMDRGCVIASSQNDRRTSITESGYSAYGAPHFIEYASTGEDVDKTGSYDAVTNRGEIPTIPAISGEWWLVTCYVVMPARSLVKSGFEGWQLRHGTSGRRVRAYPNKNSVEPVTLTLHVIHQATSTANVPNEFNLYYTHDGTQVTDARDGCVYHRISQMRLKDSRV